MDVLSFVRSIPRGWLKIARDQKRKLEKAEDQQIMKIITCKKICNYVYKKLICQTNISRKYGAKWQDNLNMELKEEDWARIFRRYREAALNSSIRSFQHKLLITAIPAKVNLIKFGIEDDNKCVFCEAEAETLQHLFWYCRHIQLWYNITHILTSCLFRSLVTFRCTLCGVRGVATLKLLIIYLC